MEAVMRLTSILVLFFMSFAVAFAHKGYEHTSAKDCCGIGKGNEHCRPADSYRHIRGSYEFIVRENPHNANSPRQKVLVADGIVKKEDLFKDGRAHWCGSFGHTAERIPSYNTYCAFVPPDGISQNDLIQDAPSSLTASAS
jgi:hypothetical protein